MHVSGLWLYPLKGAAGIALEEWSLDEFGLAHDRRWMAVDPDGGFLSQRGDPALGQLHQELTADTLVVRSATSGELALPLTPDGARSAARVWQDHVSVIDCGDEAAAFMSRHLGRAARVVHMPADTLRQADPQYARTGDRVSFVDGFPLLLITEASLDELNERLDEPVEMRRFRPNVVVAGAMPHGEDGWHTIRVGSVLCEVVKPCARCLVTTLDPDTGAAGREPLRTLGGYRRWNGKVWFGQNVIHRTTGTIAVGDAVEVLDSRSPEPPLLG